MRIIVFWDSITEWLWDYEKWGWVNMLKIHLWKKYWYDKMLMNFWISAYTSYNILTVFQYYFDWCSRREFWKEKDSTVVIEIWINDCSIDKITKEPRVNKKYFRKNINIIIDKCKKERLVKRIIFVTNTNVDEKVVNNTDDGDFLFYNKDINIYNDIIKEICTANNLEYIDLFWLMDKDDLEDWLHPNTKWHTKIFEKVKKYFN